MHIFVINFGTETIQVTNHQIDELGRGAFEVTVPLNPRLRQSRGISLERYEDLSATIDGTPATQVVPKHMHWSDAVNGLLTLTVTR